MISVHYDPRALIPHALIPAHCDPRALCSNCTVLHCAAVGASVQFIALGDWGDTALPGQAQVAQAMDDWAALNDPRFIVSTGDNFYPWGEYTGFWPLHALFPDRKKSGQ